MIQYERQQKIVDYLTHTNVAKIGELARHLYTSEASIRRDIAALEKTGIVTKVYGGVVLTRFQNEVLPAKIRESENSHLKNLIAQKAAPSLVPRRRISSFCPCGQLFLLMQGIV